jgi:hypothetical protein
MDKPTAKDKLAGTNLLTSIRETWWKGGQGQP